MAQTLYTPLVTLIASSWLNDVDANTYNALSSVSGTNTIVGTGPTTVTAYAANQRFFLTPANTNSGATTLNISSIGTMNVFWNGAACVGGELRAGVPALVVCDGTQFHIIGNGPLVSPLPITNALGANVALNNTGNYFTGPTIAQGTVGTWWVSGHVLLTDAAGAAAFNVKLWDGTTPIASDSPTMTAASQRVSCHLSGFITSPSGNLRMSVNDNSSTSGLILFNDSGNSKDSIISAIRIG